MRIETDAFFLYIYNKCVRKRIFGISRVKIDCEPVYAENLNACNFQNTYIFFFYDITDIVIIMDGDEGNM